MHGSYGGQYLPGRWTVDGSALCETKGGEVGGVAVPVLSSCSRVDILPNGQVTLTSLDGSGGFQTTASLSAGDSCF